MRSSFLALTAVAVLALAACTSGPAASLGAGPSANPASPAGPEPTPPGMTGAAPGEPGTGITDPSTLDGRTFLGATAVPSAPGDVTRVRLSFRDGQVSGSGGCNSMGGSYQLVDGVLTTGSMMTTEMACPEPAMSMDTWLATLLTGAKATLDGDKLTLSKDGVALTLVDERTARPDLPLAQQTRWVLESIGQGGANGSVSTVPAGVTSEIAFMGSRADIAYGCNSGGGEVGITAASITFGPMISTRMACGSPGDDVERLVQAALVGEVPYTIDGDTLTITGAGGITLTYKGTAG